MSETLEALRDFAVMAELWGISTSLDRLREEQWQAATRIVGSVDLVRAEVERLRSAVDWQTRVLERSLAAIDSRLDFQSHLLRKVLGALHQPSEVRARELRERGERALHAGLYDDALRDFRASLEVNPYDFTARFAVAVVELEHLGNPEAAWNSAEVAAGYTRLQGHWKGDPAAAYYLSRCLLLMGRILDDGGLVEEALHFYEAACKESPDYGECFRRYAGAACRLGLVEPAERAVRAAILVDEGEAVLVQQEETLSAMKERIEGVVASLRDEVDSAAASLHDAAGRATNACERASLVLYSNDGESPAPVLEIREGLGRSTEWRHREGLLDVVRASRLADAACHQLKWVTDRLIPGVEAQTRSQRVLLGEQLESARKRFGDEKQSAESAARDWGGVGCLVRLGCVVGMVLAYPGCMELAYGTQHGAGESLLISGVVIIVVSLLAGSQNRTSRLQRRDSRLERARGMLEEAERDYARQLADVEEGETVLEELETIHNSLESARAVLDSPEVRCSLVLLEPGASRDDFDEHGVAQGLQSVVRNFSEGRVMSMKQAKDIIRDNPAVLIDGLSVSRAERAAATLRRQCGVSVSLKRRYVGPFP